jgi:hypothetical protein
VTVDNSREMSVPVARTLQSNPLTVMDYLLGRIENMDGGILNSWVDVLKLAENLALDVGTFCLLQVRACLSCLRIDSHVHVHRMHA